MKKRRPKPVRDPDMRPEYDFSGGVRGYYASRIRPGSKLVKISARQARKILSQKRGKPPAGKAVYLDSDVAGHFPDSSAVNEALRMYLKRRKAS